MEILIGVVVVAILLVGLVLLSLFPISTYIQAVTSQVPIGMADLIGMRLRGVPCDYIVENLVKGHKGGIDLAVDRIEAHYLSGGNVSRVVDALISAARAKLDLSFARAAAIDLAGRDVLEAVQMRVVPRVLSSPPIPGYAKNGIEIIAKPKITVRANLESLIGGAGEETILARVGEGIVRAIGAAEKHSDILTNPERITEEIIVRGLDTKTAFEIVSVDIADLDVGRNIGAILQTDQAEADKKVGQARAEGRRALAIAKKQEMKALEQEMKAHLVLSESEVPMALAGAFEKGALFARNRKKIVPGATQGPGLPPPPAGPTSPATPPASPLPVPPVGGIGVDIG